MSGLENLLTRLLRAKMRFVVTDEEASIRHAFHQKLRSRGRRHLQSPPPILYRSVWVLDKQSCTFRRPDLANAAL